MSDAGTATFNNKIKVGGTTLTGASLTENGDFTIDVGGNITLDADGGNVRFKDGGTEYGTINKNGANLSIYSSTSNADMQFHGNDNGTIITALTLDMSNAGKATFNNGISSPSGHVSLGSSSWADDILYLTRSNDGKMQRFFKGTTEVCSIGTSGNQSYIHGASGQTGLYWGTNNIFPYRSTGLNHNTIDLGQPNYRFKDGYFSGNLYGDGSNLTGVGGSTNAGAVGTYGYFKNTTGSNILWGSTTSGSNLIPSNAIGINYSSSTVSGTWRAMGDSHTNYTESLTTLWVRIS
jgi:hypothetical protein